MNNKLVKILFHREYFEPSYFFTQSRLINILLPTLTIMHAFYNIPFIENSIIFILFSFYTLDWFIVLNKIYIFYWIKSIFHQTIIRKSLDNIQKLSTVRLKVFYMFIRNHFPIQNIKHITINQAYFPELCDLLGFSV